MSNFLIVSYMFYPREDAIANCLYKLIDDIIRRGDSVTVMSVSYDEHTPLREERDGYTVVRIPSPEQKKIDGFFIKISNPVLRLPFMPFAELWFKFRPVVEKRRMIKLYKELKKERKFDYILSVLEPKLNHDVACSIADEDAKWIPLNYDAYVYNIIRSPNAFLCKLREKKWIKKASAVLSLDGIPQYNEKNGYFPYKNLPNDIMYLSNLNFTGEPVVEKHDKFTIRYAGKIYNKGKSMNPFADKHDVGLDECDSMISFLRKLDPEKYSAEFYGSCCICLEEDYPDLPKCAKLMGSVPVKECRDLIFSADALINISTCTSCLVPSKLLEYIATGKPVINFYHDESDPSFTYLKQYPSAVNIRIGSDCDIDKILEAINKMEPISKQRLEEIYHDMISENVTGRMIDFIKAI